MKKGVVSLASLADLLKGGVFLKCSLRSQTIHNPYGIVSFQRSRNRTRLFLIKSNSYSKKNRDRACPGAVPAVPALGQKKLSH